jgi:integrase
MLDEPDENARHDDAGTHAEAAKPVMPRNAAATPAGVNDDLPDIVDVVMEMGRSPRPPAHLESLVETAKDYAKRASSQNTRRAYAKDWNHYTSWCRRHAVDPLPAEPQKIGLYISACAAGDTKRGIRPLSVGTIERRLSGLGWNFTQRGFSLDRGDRHIATVLADIRRKHGAPPRQKEAILAEDLLAMIETLGHDLRGLRDRAILLLGFAGGLRRSEIVGLDVVRDENGDGAGWIEFFDKGVLVTLRGKTGWREVEIGRGSSDLSCPVAALETWIKFGCIVRGPLFRRIFRGNKTVDVERLADKHVARLVKQTVLAAGIRADLPEGERELLFAGHSLRAGLASSAEVDERCVQKHLGHTSSEMTRKYQRRRDRFRVNLTKASGL